jgi:fructokinase
MRKAGQFLEKGRIAMKGRQTKVLAIGEVLWDVFGDERHLGGAPFNFTYHCHALGASSSIISRVGDDDPGREILGCARELGIDTSLIQVDPQHPTGVVEVKLDPAGVPAFDIRPDAAWDYIDLPAEAQAAAREADIICFGTLAQRKPRSWESIHGALGVAKHGCMRVCDVNLRQQFYSAEVLCESMVLSDLVKINAEELERLRGLLHLPAGEEPAVMALIEEFDLLAVVLTLGSGGAKAWSPTDVAEVHGLVVTVHDTVGSGDAFAAVFAMEMADGAPLKHALWFANVAGAYVATCHGATPEINKDILQAFARR